MCRILDMCEILDLCVGFRLVCGILVLCVGFSSYYPNSALHSRVPGGWFYVPMRPSAGLRRAASAHSDP